MTRNKVYVIDYVDTNINVYLVSINDSVDFGGVYNEKQEENGNVCYKYDMAYLFGYCKYFAIY